MEFLRPLSPRSPCLKPRFLTIFDPCFTVRYALRESALHERRSQRFGRKIMKNEGNTQTRSTFVVFRSSSETGVSPPSFAYEHARLNLFFILEVFRLLVSFLAKVMSPFREKKAHIHHFGPHFTNCFSPFLWRVSCRWRVLRNLTF